MLKINNYSNKGRIRANRVRFLERCRRAIINYKKHNIAITRKAVLHEIGHTTQDWDRFLARLTAAYNQLDAIEFMFINNIFRQDQLHGLWRGIYPTSTFYKIRNRAIVDFLRYYNA